MASFHWEGTRKKKVKFWHSAIGTRDQVKLGSRSEDCTGMGDRRLGVFESEAQEQELSQVELPRELLREAQKGGCRGLVRLLTSCQYAGSAAHKHRRQSTTCARVQDGSFRLSQQD